MLKFAALLMAFTFCFALITSAQGVKKYVTQHYTVKDGLSSNNIRHIAQDGFGYLWLSTQDGLNRSDGNSFTQYTTKQAGSKKTFSMDVRMAVMNEKYLWVLNSASGLNKIDPVTGNVIRTVKSLEKDHDNWYITMRISNGNLWIGGNNGLRIYNTRNNTWENAPSLPFPKNKDLFTIRSIYSEHNRIWVLVNNYGIVIFDPVTKNILNVILSDEFCPEKTLEGLNFSSVAELEKNNYIIGTSAGVKKITFNRSGYSILHDPLPSGSPLNRDKISAIVNSGAHIYISCQSGLFQSDKILKKHVQMLESPANREAWFHTINFLFIDAEKNLWTGSSQGLACIKSPAIKNPVSPFERVCNAEFPEASFNQVYFAKPHGKNFLVCMERGLVSCNASTGSFKLIEGKKTYNYIFEDFCGNTVISADDGLYLFKNNGLIPISEVYPELAALNGNYINTAIPFGDSVYVLSSDNSRGIFVWNYKNKKVYTINTSSPLKLASNIINKLYKDKKGNIWVLSDLGIDIIDKNFKTINHLTMASSKADIPKLFFDICESGQGYWLTSYGYGLIELDSNLKFRSLYNTQNGLSSDGVYCIFHKNHKLIISTNDGLSVFDTRDSSFSNFYESDGLHSNAFEENCGTIENGKFYVGGLNGFTIVDPDFLYDKKNIPKVYFTKISLETQNGTTDTSNLFIHKLEVPSDVVRATVHFSALYYADPARTKTFYRIEEINKAWIEAAGQNFVNLIGMKPGKYTIQVRAENENKQSGKKLASITLVFLPKWYQTFWFNLAAACLIILIFYLAYLLRIGQIKNQQKIRKDIASDLHDDIGGSLNTVKVFTHLAMREKDNEKYLHEIEETLLQASSGMRDMIWVLDDQNDTWQDLIERIEKFALPVLAAQNIQFMLKIKTEARNLILNKKEKKNLLLISKESITNCIKYAQCRTISISLQEYNRQIIFKIEDDGCGFDPQNIKEGNGLKNIRYRALQIGFKLSIQVALKTGTSIVLSKKINTRFNRAEI